MDGALAGAWVILSVALFFIFFAKKIAFHHSVHSLWKGEHAI